MRHRIPRLSIEVLILGVLGTWLWCVNSVAIAYSRPASDDFCVAGLKEQSDSWLGFLKDIYLNQNGRVVSVGFYDAISTFNSPFSGYWPSRLAFSLIALILVIYAIGYVRSSSDFKSVFAIILFGSLVAFELSNCIMITATWLPAVTNHVVPSLLGLGLIILWANKPETKFLLPSLVIVGLMQETELFIFIGIAAWKVITSYKKIKTVDLRNFIWLLFVFCFVIASPGNRDKVSGYNVLFNADEIFKKIVIQKDLILSLLAEHKILLIGFFLFSFLLPQKRIAFENQVKYVGIASLVSFAYITITVTTTYDRFDYLVYLVVLFGLLAQTLGLKISGLKGSQIKNRYRSSILSVSILGVGIYLMASIPALSDQMRARAIQFDNASFEISTAIQKGETTYAYPTFSSPIAEAGNYIPAKNCASQWYGISIE
jgi:hypothetical protein